MKNDFRNAKLTGVQFGNGNTINHIVVKGAGKSPKIQYRSDQIGGNNDWHGYIHYLVDKTVVAQTGSGWQSSHQKVHKLIEREFGNKTFMLPLEFAPAVAQFLTDKIDQTRLARGLSHKFYHSFEEHQAKGKKGEA